VSEKKRADMYSFVNGKLKEGGRTFIVLPMIEDSDEAIALRSVAGTFEMLSNIEYFSGLVGYVHGKMDADEKKEAIELFRSGSRPILVSTTVVEVGVDVPEADIMIIEHPERFGLAQLHQLRGRVGRGKKESFCFLLAGNGGGAQSLERLRKFAATNDGFEIAEIDLLNRGAGELSGLNQSGMPEFKYLNFCRDKAQIEAAREDALAIIENPSLVSANELSEIRNRLKVFDGLRAELLSTA
jgi:ATP-dependent DNA helicase RecG